MYDLFIILSTFENEIFVEMWNKLGAEGKNSWFLRPPLKKNDLLSHMSCFKDYYFLVSNFVINHCKRNRIYKEAL